METMKAAVVTSFDEAPHYLDFEVPSPASSGGYLVDVLAVGLHPRVRTGASGAHYTSTRTLPMIPGIDGVGRRSDGKLVYFATDDDVVGTMAEKALVDPRRALELPDDADVAVVAAAMNPAMSGWLAMRTRAALRAGERVLVLGANGAAGRAAVALAGHLGATVVAAGRNAEVLAGLGADVTVSLEPAPAVTDPDPVAAVLAEHGAEVDVVVDYLWGQQTERALASVLGGSRDPAKPLRWVQVSTTAGPDITLPGALLRSSALQLTGSGLGSVSPARMAAELAELLVVLVGLPPTTTPELTPLADVERAWTTEPATGHRIVFVP